MPSSRVFFLLALTTVLVVAGVVVPDLGRLALLLDGAILAAFAVDYLRVRRAALVAERRWPRLLVQGAEAEVTVELASGDARSRRVRLRDTLNPALAVAPRRTELELPARGRLAWSYRIRPRRRGEHLSGPLVARILGPWRLAWTQRQLLAGEPRRVYPQVRWDGKVGHLLVLAHRRSLGRHPQRIRGLCPGGAQDCHQGSWTPAPRIRSVPSSSGMSEVWARHGLSIGEGRRW